MICSADGPVGGGNHSAATMIREDVGLV